ncbi:linear amide C-N hydrolase, choloylglycine hydrolase family protein [Oesophagostomum dentatum]|uniref:Linear amide C-N hydrolase, choloylglycine hydrolase family protein n=1 Tax=Oesophagostomum dentatum TaxID=61180 RepID=A0A0B1TRP1_OESDE|nr:linear amide C-N hydrolase, choloylglycine hydrolase family protein [Oesophagostomum dentatum]
MFVFGCVLLTVASYLCEARIVPNPDFPTECRVGEANLYDPAQSMEVPWFNVDLDAPPKERFKHVVRPFKNQIQAVFDVLGHFFEIIPGIPIWEMLGDLMLKVFEEGMIMEPYKDEVQGIADELGCNLGQLAFLNIFYELSRFCTSIVAQPTRQQRYVACKLFVWNIDAQSWDLSDTLKNVTVNLNFIRNGTVLFKGTTLAGHVGILTGMKPNAFSLSMNSKVEPDIKNVIAWLNGDRPDIQFAMYFDRKIFEEANTFDEARQFIYDVPLLSGAYFILGGNKPGEGSVIVRNVTSVQFERKLFDGDNDWFLLQTNYDPDKEPLYLDNRRGPGNDCMKQLGQSRVNAEGIYQVLKSRPVLNKTTIHTVIMSVTKDIYQTFIQTCPNPCWAF